MSPSSSGRGRAWPSNSHAGVQCRRPCWRGVMQIAIAIAVAHLCRAASLRHFAIHGNNSAQGRPTCPWCTPSPTDPGVALPRLCKRVHTRVLLRSSLKALAQRQACSGLRKGRQGDPSLNGNPLSSTRLYDAITRPSRHAMPHLAASRRHVHVTLPQVVHVDMAAWATADCEHGKRTRSVYRRTAARAEQMTKWWQATASSYDKESGVDDKPSGNHHR